LDFVPPAGGELDANDVPDDHAGPPVQDIQSGGLLKIRNPARIYATAVPGPSNGARLGMSVTGKAS